MIEREKAQGTYKGGRPEGTKKEISKTAKDALLRAIQKGDYIKERLSVIAEMSLPTFRRWLKENPPIEALRAKNELRNLSKTEKNRLYERNRRLKKVVNGG